MGEAGVPQSCSRCSGPGTLGQAFSSFHLLSRLFLTQGQVVVFQSMNHDSGAFEGIDNIYLVPLTFYRDHRREWGRGNEGAVLLPAVTGPVGSFALGPDARSLACKEGLEILPGDGGECLPVLTSPGLKGCG